jgi:hypothetical protein
MRNAINTTAIVTTTAIVNRQVRTVLAGVDASRASLRQSRLYAASAPGHRLHAAGPWAFTGKQKPACMGPMTGGSELSRCRSRESSRCGRSRVSGCLPRS